MRKFVVCLISCLFSLGALASTNLVTLTKADFDGDADVAIRKLNKVIAVLDALTTNSAAKLSGGITTNKPILVPNGSGGYITNTLTVSTGVIK